MLGIGSEESKMIWQNACNKFVKIENLVKIDISIHNANDNYRGIDDVRKIIDFGFDNSQMDDDRWISFSNFGVTIRL
jgi:hypothetical protein